MKSGMRWAGSSLLAVLLVCGMAAAPLRAQSGDDEGTPPAIAMGSGRMVRGTVTAVAGDKVTLKTENGDVFQVVVTPNTRVMKGRQPAKIAEIKAGDGIGAMGEMDPATRTVHALFVSVVDADEVKKMRESLGKTWISGKVTAIDETRLTILRGDKVSQVIEVDEDTSFKRGGRGMRMMMQGDSVTGNPPGARAGGGSGAAGGQQGGQQGEGGESITLADVKVGDNVAGQGSLKHGVFVPTTLAVVEPGQRRRREGGSGAPAGPPNGSGGPGAEPK
jgi:hypothetical protein